jgi:hypothetical protein
MYNAWSGFGHDTGHAHSKEDAFEYWVTHLQAGERLSHLAEAYPDCELLFAALASDHFATVADAVQPDINAKNDLVRVFRYRYVIERLQENRYSVSLPNPSNVEKAFDRIKTKGPGYVFGRFLLDTGWFVKVLALLALIFMAYGFVHFINLLLKWFRTSSSA